ncbi:GGDEF domain-containing protein [Paractinoplanes rishiriensis]|uniref:GGDEF domain-containing protein n=1 Tax=Paractinoplanes rishiriensis TaxID=1050105 RepID=A0A919K4G9_9ACTN|nr:GGDEF domain-containing protein [Actinoplanes rishiriensis]GIE98614.1 hypothetical protein Ari01nite_60790 [Actinoplanes rishiriensis]
MTSDEIIARAEVDGLPADRLAARALAHTLIELTQVAPRPDLVRRLTAEARDRGWHEVLVQFVHCQLITYSLDGAGQDAIRQCSDVMLAAAEASADEIQIGLALAARALFLVEAPRPEALTQDFGELLGRAVAMLDDTMAADAAGLGPRAIELPMAYVECGQAFHRMALWELEEEMYAKAAAAQELPLPPLLRPLKALTARVLVINRLEGATAMACALFEIGEREAARYVATAAVRPTPAERADLPPIWGWEVSALEHLLDTVAGVAPDAEPDGLVGRLANSTWPGYKACLCLASAIRAHDRGDVAAAARHADEAVRLLDDYKPSFTTLAMHLAAQASDDRAALRYGRHLAALRWETRLSVLGSARSRLAAARVLRQGEQLNRQAYLDALTGCANRHAETRHLARLRRRDPADRLVVVLVDVDHFKSVNDTFGHAAGDEVLREIGTVLQAEVRAGDLAVRRGGDEFMLLVDLPPDATVPLIAPGLVAAVSRHDWSAVAPGLRVGVSAGQAAGPAREVDDLIHAADQNLYRAKHAGRGQAVGAA